MTVQQNRSSDDNPVLCEFMVRQIAARPHQRITFAEYMDLVLYHPEHGYYATQSDQIGAEGDFFTSPHLGADFGELLAEQLAEMWQILGQPSPFTLVEMGAGQGLLAHDILRYLHRHHYNCFEAIHYIIDERSPALKAEQQRRLGWLGQIAGKLVWRSLDSLPSQSIIGCCFSNELVDAFPVHRVVLESGMLREVYVASGDAGQFQDILADLSTPLLADYFNRIGIDLTSGAYPDGYQTEVNLAALDWISTISDRLQRGYVLTIDYGYLASRYYAPSRSQGTLQCYYQHRHHSDPYRYIGRQDLTAHVDFTALERQGEHCGLQTLGFTQQGLFLMALGLGDRLMTLSDPTVEMTLQDRLRHREALHSLVNPMGLGGFGVLVQAKGLSEAELGRSLKGLKVPD